MIILATQKKIISKPVTRTFVGWYLFRSLVEDGHPRVENVHNEEENQVSNTSSSCFKINSSSSWYFFLTDLSSSAT